jgi:hypothetical protein
MTEAHGGAGDGPIALITPDTQACAAGCPHPDSTHDATSRRWCAATASSGSARKCICPEP